jgi:hypothetical protein
MSGPESVPPWLGEPHASRAHEAARPNRIESFIPRLILKESKERIPEFAGIATGLSRNSGRRELEAIRDAGQATTGFQAEGVAETYVEAWVPVGNEPGARSDPA